MYEWCGRWKQSTGQRNKGASPIVAIRERFVLQTMYLSYTSQLLFCWTVGRPNPDAFYYPFERAMRDGWPFAIETCQCFVEVPLFPRIDELFEYFLKLMSMTNFKPLAISYFFRREYNKTSTLVWNLWDIWSSLNPKRRSLDQINNSQLTV